LNDLGSESYTVTSPSRICISRDEIRAVYAQGEDAVIALVEGLVARINHLEERLEAVENQLKKDSHNSSKPPSSDGFKKRTKSLRQKSERLRGGQLGQLGRTLDWSNELTRGLIHPVVSCGDCGTSLVNTPVESWELRQVHDLPQVSIDVTEHQSEVKCCPNCGILNRGSFPVEVKYPIQYGPNVQAWIVYLMVVQLIPSLRICELLSEAFNISLSEGTLYNIRQRCFDALEQPEQYIKDALKASKTVHYDETGFGVGSKLWWLHVGCTESLTAYFVHQNRGKKAMDAMGLLPEFEGIAVHDGWSSYGQYHCLHSLCNAHHLRELTFLVERFEQGWAQEMIDLLVEMNQAVNLAKSTTAESLDSSQITRFETQYEEILARGLVENPVVPEAENTPKRKGRPKQSKAKNLLDRLTNHQESVLRFLHDFQVPFDNNQAERDIRMMKLKQKISGGFRSESGARIFSRIRGYLSTLRKQGHNIWGALVQLFMGNPVSPIPKAE
jgi:transposase